MMNIDLFRHHNNHEDEARIILTGSSGSVLPPVALWVALSYRLTPGQGGLHCSRGGVLNIKVFHMGGGVDCGVWTSGQGFAQDQGASIVFHNGRLVDLKSPVTGGGGLPSSTREGFLQKTQQCIAHLRKHLGPTVALQSARKSDRPDPCCCHGWS